MNIKSTVSCYFNPDFDNETPSGILEIDGHYCRVNWRSSRAKNAVLKAGVIARLLWGLQILT